MKYRQALILPSFDQRLYEYMGGIAREMGQSALAINGWYDHIHICAKLKPAMAPAKFIQNVKSFSSKWINEQGFLSTRFEWQTGGWIVSVDQYGMEGLLQYIRNQKEHHRKKPFRTEYMELLKKYELEFKDEYLPEFFDVCMRICPDDMAFLSIRWISNKCILLPGLWPRQDSMLPKAAKEVP